ncbi:hypothetical protein NI26_08595 [Curtobacterium sp. MR_MD2014]|nr:hypothetical protein NI26_08595 [Curtobacterium sp. MR_MD2014]
MARLRRVRPAPPVRRSAAALPLHAVSDTERVVRQVRCRTMRAYPVQAHRPTLHVTIDRRDVGRYPYTDVRGVRNAESAAGRCPAALSA